MALIISLVQARESDIRAKHREMALATSGQTRPEGLAESTLAQHEQH